DWVSGAYSDWYLPSLDELSLLWHNRFNVNKTLTIISGASLLPVAAYYWSSTEVNSDFAWYFDYGFANFKSKASTYYVRAVRRF
ncbi:MAG TPA: DUF1566 domain-containing protein, partial [Prolixibacteraceae bacterium]|nr:DUF1566 domain-containing protein [Prolixibacteraceae bacterium]